MNILFGFPGREKFLYICGSLAQWFNWIEHQTSDLAVGGSSPPWVTKRLPKNL